MKILALNSGSSSVKYTLFDAGNNYQVVNKGFAERIGQKNSSIGVVVENSYIEKVEISLPNHRTAVYALHEALIKNSGASGGEVIDAVGHRIVHGGERLRDSVIIDQYVIKEMKAAAQFAPLHCQPNIIGIEVLQELLPKAVHVAVFDTGVHRTMKSKAFLYALPLEYYEKHKIRKYGFHGINHSYAAKEAAGLLKKKIEELRLITCHLGNGCSITAFKEGKSIDNSMGLTPLEGLVMGTRCGDIDPSVLLYLIDELGMNTAEIAYLLNKKSGLLGLCGKSDMRDIIAMAEGGHRLSQKAIEIFVYRIQKYIGAFIAALNGVDAIVFTGGIGENSSFIREQVAEAFSYVGAAVDKKRNDKHEAIFSTGGSKVALMTIPANEEQVIAQETYQLITRVPNK